MLDVLLAHNADANAVDGNGMKPVHVRSRTHAYASMRAHQHTRARSALTCALCVLRVRATYPRARAPLCARACMSVRA
jgi:hypothetical protein